MNKVISALCLILCTSVSHADEVAISKPINSVGARLIQAVIKDQSEPKNVMISPVSMYLAMAMAAQGSGGATDETIRQFLSATGEAVLSREGINSLVNSCQTLLITPENQRQNSWEPKPSQVNLANSIWNTTRIFGEGKFRFSPQFVEKIKDLFHGQTTSLDFGKEESATAINQWAESNTRGLIKKIVELNDIKDLFYLLINASYFEGTWQSDFFPVNPNSNESIFTLADRSTKPVDMIRSKAYFKYLNRPTEEVIELPFNNSSTGPQYSFYVVLPKSGERLAESYWREGFWNQTLGEVLASEAKRGTIVLPKFAFDHGVTLTEQSPITKALGLELLFSDLASFPEIGTEDSLASNIKFVKQAARVELDEHGVKAAAVTSVGGGMATSMPPPPVFDMIVNHPFAFAIVDNNTQTMVFLGEVIDPTLK